MTPTGWATTVTRSLDIVDEEVKSFFAGERSAQETADMIQNRVSLLISEQS